MRIPAPLLETYVAEIFKGAGCPDDESDRIAFYLVRANLAGHDSHGVIRGPRYLSWMEIGSVKAGVQPNVVSEGPTHAVVDGCFGFGQSIGPFCADIGIAKAEEHGLSIVAIRNSGHLGRIGDWPERAADAGIASLHFVNTSGLGLLVAPYGSPDRRFSTNPFAAGVPIPGEEPLILDFATSVVAEGKVLVAHQGGKPLPDGALISADGEFSTNPELIYGVGTAANPNDMRDGGGAIRAMGEHKGSGLAFLCEVLAGALTGSGCATPEQSNLANGMLSFYFRPDLLGSENEFAAEMERYLAFFRTARPLDGTDRVMIPGEPENRSRADRLANGIPLTDTTWESICSAGDNYGVRAPALVSEAIAS